MEQQLERGLSAAPRGYLRELLLCLATFAAS